MLPQIKHILKTFGLADANKILALWLTSDALVSKALPYVQANAGYTDALRRFTMLIVDDKDDTDKKQELPFQSILSKTFFNAHVNTVEDVMCHMLHTTSHQQCDIFWTKCPIPMNSFTPSELDILEEIYNQRLVLEIAPALYDYFPQTVVAYDQCQGTTLTPTRTELQSLFTQTPIHSVQEMNSLHQWLYSVNPLHQDVFNTYFKLCQLLLTDDRIKQTFKVYAEC